MCPNLGKGPRPTLVVWVLVPDVRDEDILVMIPALKVLSSKTLEGLGHRDVDHFNILLGYVTDAMVLDTLESAKLRNRCMFVWKPLHSMVKTLMATSWQFINIIVENPISTQATLGIPANDNGFVVVSLVTKNLSNAISDCVQP